MYNWSVAEKELKEYPEQHAIWRLEQLINFGLNNEKIDRKELIRYFPQLQLDPARRRFFEFLLQ